MPFAEPLGYVRGHTISGRAENKSFSEEKKFQTPSTCTRNAISRRYNAF